jgi:hypothetical protein
MVVKAMIVREFGAEKIMPVLAGALYGILFAMVSGAFHGSLRPFEA